MAQIVTETTVLSEPPPEEHPFKILVSAVSFVSPQTRLIITTLVGFAVLVKFVLLLIKCWQSRAELDNRAWEKKTIQKNK